MQTLTFTPVIRTKSNLIAKNMTEPTNLLRTIVFWSVPLNKVFK